MVNALEADGIVSAGGRVGGSGNFMDMSERRLRKGASQLASLGELVVDSVIASVLENLRVDLFHGGGGRGYWFENTTKEVVDDW